MPGRVLGANKPGQQPAVAAGLAYLSVLWRAGAVEMVVAPRSLGSGGADGLLDQADGLMLLGGPDIDPALYGEEPQTATYGVQREQDDFEIALLHRAVERDMPVLAICRGMQVLNVAMGGDLHQDVAGDGYFPRRPEGFPTPTPGAARPLVEVAVQPGCRLAAALGTTALAGAHAHHQAVRQVGEGLTVTATASDGVVEAVEHERGWVLGVQWHPEDPSAASEPAHQRLVDTFVSRAGAGAGAA